jgi:hypothetical protein
VEHLSLPYDPASRRLFGVPIVATVSQAAGVGHLLAADAVALDADKLGVGVQWSETSRNPTASTAAAPVFSESPAPANSAEVSRPIGVACETGMTEEIGLTCHPRRLRAWRAITTAQRAGAMSIVSIVQTRIGLGGCRGRGTAHERTWYDFSSPLATQMALSSST